MSTQIIALKDRTDLPESSRILAWRLFAFELRHRGLGGSMLSDGRRTSHLEFDADFHHLRAGNLEIGARPLRVVMHEGEQLLAPARHAGPASGSDDRLVPSVVRHVARVALSDLAARHCELEPLGHIRLLHKPEPQL